MAQVVAKTLGFGQDYAQISVKPVDVNVHPNNAGTGGSTTSEMTCVVSGFSLFFCEQQQYIHSDSQVEQTDGKIYIIQAAQKACEEIRKKLDAVAANLPEGTPTPMLIGAAMMGGVSLTAEHG